MFTNSMPLSLPPFTVAIITLAVAIAHNATNLVRKDRQVRLAGPPRPRQGTQVLHVIKGFRACRGRRRAGTAQKTRWRDTCYELGQRGQGGEGREGRDSAPSLHQLWASEPHKRL